jgi:hypothetical protein
MDVPTNETSKYSTSKSNFYKVSNNSNSQGKGHFQ